MSNWIRRLLGKRAPTGQDTADQPVLLRAEAFAENDIGSAKWKPEHSAHLLSVTNDGRTIEWAPLRRSEGQRRPVWVPIPTRLHLHSGHFRWDFIVDEMATAQIGIGFMLLWNVGPDWGFFGYLGASSTAWSYDPSTGDVVCATKSIQGELPTFLGGRSGVVSVDLNLPRTAEGEGKFIIDNVETRPVRLPLGAVVLPAACLLKETQKVTLSNVQRL